jgi:hypothetical protein
MASMAMPCLGILGRLRRGSSSTRAGGIAGRLVDLQSTCQLSSAQSTTVDDDHMTLPKHGRYAKIAILMATWWWRICCVFIFRQILLHYTCVYSMYVYIYIYTWYAESIWYIMQSTGCSYLVLHSGTVFWGLTLCSNAALVLIAD